MSKVDTQIFQIFDLMCRKIVVLPMLYNINDGNYLRQAYFHRKYCLHVFCSYLLDNIQMVLPIYTYPPSL